MIIKPQRGEAIRLAVVRRVYDDAATSGLTCNLIWVLAAQAPSDDRDKRMAHNAVLDFSMDHFFNLVASCLANSNTPSACH